MLFSSFLFVLIFLPISLLGYALCSKISMRWGIVWLVFISTIFYGWLNPYFLSVIYLSIIFNYFAAKWMVQTCCRKKAIFIGSICVNILALVSFKYLDFFISNINYLGGFDIPLLHIALPLAISFFTFQQIGFLVDVYCRASKIPDFENYTCFIIFFPQLIAGPIVRHTDYLPQIEQPKTFNLSSRNLAIGATIFALGLFKKTVLADRSGKIADVVFGAISGGYAPSFLEAWAGAIFYSFQIYFDFSGYSDMAIGLARLFNIYLPCNFLSPYKSESIIEFWRKWHISLSLFLKEHIYIPLGGNRKGRLARYGNLLVTMLIGGLWHGASWNFVIWGGIHGIFLIVNHSIKSMAIFDSPPWIKRIVVFLLVTVAWVFFRAKNLQEACVLLNSMISIDQFALPDFIARLSGLGGIKTISIPLETLVTGSLFAVSLILITFFMPNIYEWMRYFRPAKDFTASLKSQFFRKTAWRPTLLYSAAVLILFLLAFAEIDGKNEFIYFQF